MKSSRSIMRCNNEIYRHNHQVFLTCDYALIMRFFSSPKYKFAIAKMKRAGINRSE